MSSKEQDHHESARTDYKVQKWRVSLSLAVTLFPAAYTFNLISAKYKSPIICLLSGFTVQRHIASQCDFTGNSVSLPPCVSGV